MRKPVREEREEGRERERERERESEREERDIYLTVFAGSIFLITGILIWIAFKSCLYSSVFERTRSQMPCR